MPRTGPGVVGVGVGVNQCGMHNLETGESFRFTCPITSSRLHHAAMHGDVTSVKQLINSGADVNMIFKTVPPIYVAAMFDQVGVIRALLDAHCDVNAKTIELEQTALHVAVSRGYLEACKVLSENGANINQRDCDGATAVMLAATNGVMSVLRYLIDIGADMNLGDNRGLTPLAAAVQNANLAAVEVLLRSGAVLDVTDNQGNTELFHAVKGGQADICRALVGAGACVNVRNSKNECPISVAAMYGNSPITDVLIGGGCDVNIVASVGTPLYAAVERQHINVVRMLIAAGADATGAGNAGSSGGGGAMTSSSSSAAAASQPRLALTEALHQHKPNADIIIELVRAGCDVDDVSCDCHDSPINTVINKCNIPIVVLLMQFDSQPGTITAAKMDEIRQYCPYTYDYLLDYESSRVRSLKALTRKVIKRSCGTVHHQRRVEALPVPTAVRKYLLHYDVKLPNPDDFKCPDALKMGSRFRKPGLSAAAAAAAAVPTAQRMQKVATSTAAGEAMTSQKLNTRL